MWLRAAIFFVAFAAIAAVVLGRLHWRSGTRELRRQIAAGLRPAPPRNDNVPAPVARYLSLVLPSGAPPIASARFQHTGTFNMSESGANWRPFTSHQTVTLHRPGFDWDARIQMAPGVAAFVHDAYVNGSGLLRVRALGFLPLVDIYSNPEINTGELQRFLAEAIWYPSPLASSHIFWEPLGPSTARATLRDGAVAASVDFHFDDAGLLASVTADRFRVVNGVSTLTPWLCAVSNYQRHDGILIPIEGEVSWLLPQGNHPYWRATLTHIEYDFERSSS